jgi:hypothetical protein
MADGQPWRKARRFEEDEDEDDRNSFSSTSRGDLTSMADDELATPGRANDYEETAGDEDVPDWRGFARFARSALFLFENEKFHG